MWGRRGATLVVLLVVLLDERLGLQRDAGELIEADLHQPYLNGVAALIECGAHPAGAVPLQPVRPPPRAAVLLGVPLGQLVGPGQRRRYPEDLRLGDRGEGRIDNEHPLFHGGDAGAAARGPASPPGTAEPRSLRDGEGEPGRAGGWEPALARSACRASGPPPLAPDAPIRARQSTREHPPEHPPVTGG